MCTFCVFGSNQGCYYQDELTGEAAMSRQISQHMLVSTLWLFLSLRHNACLTLPSLFFSSHLNRSVSISSCICAALTRNKHLLMTQPSTWVFVFAVVLLMSCVWDWASIHSVGPVFTPTAVGLLRCGQDSDVAGQRSGQTAEAALPDCWRVCVRRPAHFHQLRLIQPSKKPCADVELRGFHHQLNIHKYN